MSQKGEGDEEQTITIDQARHTYRIRARRMMQGFYADDDMPTIWGYTLRQVPGHPNLWDIYYKSQDEQGEETLRYWDTLNIKYHTSASSIVAEMERILPEGTLTEEDVDGEDEPSPSFQ